MAPDAQAPVAALDCGTNSTRLLVVDASGATLHREMRITRLGEGVDATGKLAPEAIDRTCAVLIELREEMDALGVGRARLVATSAVRDAANRAEFVDAAAQAAGVVPEILTGDEEGRLSYAGATADVDPVAGDDVVVDIGGGSTELVTARAGRIEAVSLDLGCVRLTERYLAHDPPRDHEVAAAVGRIDDELARALSTVAPLANLRPESRLLGLAGTVSTLAALDEGLAIYDRNAIHHFVLSSEAVARWCDLLLAEPAATRARRPGMVPGREDVIVGGALVLRQVLSTLGLPTCTVSEADLLDGIARSLLGWG